MDAERIAAGLGTVPTYHNICGRRTIYHQCGCEKCLAVRAEIEKEGK